MKKYTHPDSNQEIEVAPGHEDAYLDAGWVEKSAKRKTTTTEGNDNGHA